MSFTISFYGFIDTEELRTTAAAQTTTVRMLPIVAPSETDSASAEAQAASNFLRLSGERQCIELLPRRIENGIDLDWVTCDYESLDPLFLAHFRAVTVYAFVDGIEKHSCMTSITNGTKAGTESQVYLGVRTTTGLAYGQTLGIPPSLHQHPRQSNIIHFRVDAFLDHVENAQNIPSLISPNEKDVVFLWGREGASCRTLWANSYTLSLLSPYFRRLFLSPTSHAHGIINHDGRKDFHKQLGYLLHNLRNNRGYNPILDEDDSDFDGNRAHFASFYKNRQDTPAYVPPKVQYIVPCAVAFKTYRSVLHYLTTRQIHFAPLSALFRSNFNDNHTRGRPATHPLAASPKAVYRLARQLELPELCQQALQSYTQQMTPQIAISEYFSESCARYPELAKIAYQAVSSMSDPP